MHSKAIELMYHEHDIILKAISQLKQILSTDDLVSGAGKIQWYIKFFKEYGDNFHHRKEEDILFNILGSKNEMLAGGLVDELTDHHSQFRHALGESEIFLQNSDLKNAKKTLMAYMNDLTDHIGAENDELFVSAEMILNESEKEKLYFLFMDSDNELNTETKKDFENLILNPHYIYE